MNARIGFRSGRPLWRHNSRGPDRIRDRGRRACAAARPIRFGRTTTLRAIAGFETPFSGTSSGGLNGGDSVVK